MSRIACDLTAITAVAFDVDGVLSPSTIPMDVNGQPLRMVNIKDGYALQFAVKSGLRIAIVTGADSKAIEVRFRSLGIEDIYLKSSDKASVMRGWMEKRGLSAENVAFVGDDIPDLPAMALVSLPVAPHDAAPEVRDAARYISPVDGGYGVARDILEQILKARGNWLDDTNAFGW